MNWHSYDDWLQEWSWWLTTKYWLIDYKIIFLLSNAINCGHDSIPNYRCWDVSGLFFFFKCKMIKLVTNLIISKTNNITLRRFRSQLWHCHIYSYQIQPTIMVSHGISALLVARLTLHLLSSGEWHRLRGTPLAETSTQSAVRLFLYIHEYTSTDISN